VGCAGLSQRVTYCSIVPTINSMIEQSTLVMNGHDCDVSTNDAVGFTIVMRHSEIWLVLPTFWQRSGIYSLNSKGVEQDHVHHHFVWCNAKSFSFFSLWEKAGLCFQCILKSILHEKTTNELLICLDTLLRACSKHLCMWLCSLTENFSDADFFTPLMCLASGKKSIEQLHPGKLKHQSC